MEKLSRKVEDYLEAILMVSGSSGYARTKDVAEFLGVSPPSVAEMFNKLREMNLIVYRRYNGAILTDSGRLVAETIRCRHEIIERFLVLIGVPDEIADCDACIMEHELNSETVERLRLFVDFLEDRQCVYGTTEQFSTYCREQVFLKGSFKSDTECDSRKS